MKVKEIFDLALKMGLKSDPRGVNAIKKYLQNIQKDYENLSKNEQKFFDKEMLTNPYADSRIHNDDGKTEVKRILTGIDIAESELLLASQLGERNQKIDLVIAHHPIGKSLADLHAVMNMQIDIFEDAGIPVHVAEKIMEERISEVSRSVHPSNHYKIIDMAKLLKVNLLNIHTITDNLVHEYLQKYFTKMKPETLGEMVDLLLEIPEYAEAKKRGAGPYIFAGNKRNKVGKWIMEMTGGTNPADSLYKELSNYGVSTVVGMHMRDGARKVANEYYMNVLIAGHMASDSLGMNLFLDELEKKGIEILPVGGLIRHSRNKK
ncbi:MAG: NGG1p interacting factor NIF3 [Patescibacteria group bacterium]